MGRRLNGMYMNQGKLTDESPMPYGIHEGKLMEEVPDKYLLWLLENKKASPPVKAYIEENLDAIKENIARQERYRKMP